MVGRWKPQYLHRLTNVVLKKLSGRNSMSKVIINMGYRSIVVDVEAAIEIARLMSGAEVYESKYRSAQDGKPSYNTHHIYPMEQDYAFTMQMVTNESYNMYKMAGKPDNN
jgi:hypothetical protein